MAPIMPQEGPRPWGRGRSLRRMTQTSPPSTTNPPDAPRSGIDRDALDEAVELVDAFLAEPFSGDPRHQRRIDQLAAYEAARGTSA